MLNDTCRPNKRVGAMRTAYQSRLSIIEDYAYFCYGSNTVWQCWLFRSTFKNNTSDIRTNLP